MALGLGLALTFPPPTPPRVVPEAERFEEDGTQRFMEDGTPRKLEEEP